MRRATASAPLVLVAAVPRQVNALPVDMFAATAAVLRLAQSGHSLRRPRNAWHATNSAPRQPILHCPHAHALVQTLAPSVRMSNWVQLVWPRALLDSTVMLASARHVIASVIPLAALVLGLQTASSARPRSCQLQARVSALALPISPSQSSASVLPATLSAPRVALALTPRSALYLLACARALDAGACVSRRAAGFYAANTTKVCTGMSIIN